MNQACIVDPTDYSVNPSFGFHNHPKIDVLIVVGGVHTEEMSKRHVIEWINR